MTLPSYAILSALLLLCLGSFGWGMRNFFVRPARMTGGMKAAALAGAGSAVLHFLAIAGARNLSATPACVGAAVYAGSLALFWWAIRANRARPLGACFSECGPVHLNRRGPYRFVRHPFYCSYLLAWLAGAVATRSAWLLPATGVMMAIYTIAAIREERQFALGPLAGEYREYRLQTGRFLPKPHRRHAFTSSTAIAS